MAVNAKIVVPRTFAPPVIKGLTDLRYRQMQRETPRSHERPPGFILRKMVLSRQ
ncbi:MAG: hypothetical protein WBE90_15530 [Xanthobacteraceae bacterium]